MGHSRQGRRAAIAATLLAVATSLLGCGEQYGSNVPDPAATAYDQFKEAGRLFDCFPAYDVVLAAGRADTFDIPALRTAAGEYSGRNTAYLAALERIDFPAGAKPIAIELRTTVTTEISDLDMLSGIATQADGYPLLNQVYYAEAAFNEISDRLRESLDRPVPLATRALSQLEVARQRAQKDMIAIHQLFDTALATGDIDAARNVSGIQQSLLLQYSSSLDAIDFPDAFDARVADLKAKIRASITYLKRQVDVPRVTMIVASPPEGGPEYQAREQAAASISDDLAKVDPPQLRPPDCPSR